MTPPSTFQPLASPITTHPDRSLPLNSGVKPSSACGSAATRGIATTISGIINQVRSMSCSPKSTGPGYAHRLLTDYRGADYCQLLSAYEQPGRIENYCSRGAGLPPTGSVLMSMLLASPISSEPV